MSGGYFDYYQHYITSIAEDVYNLIESNDDTTLNQYGDTNGLHYPGHIIEHFKEGLKVLEQAAIYATRIDYLVSGDDGEESFIKRLEKELIIVRENKR